MSSNSCFANSSFTGKNAYIFNFCIIVFTFFDWFIRFSSIL